MTEQLELRLREDAKLEDAPGVMQDYYQAGVMIEAADTLKRYREALEWIVERDKAAVTAAAHAMASHARQALANRP